MHKKRILVAGATGYVGGRLVPLLLASGYPVRALTRSRQKVLSRPWGRYEGLEIAQGDMHDLESVCAALQDCDIVYYLVHSMESGQRDFSDADRRAAYNMVRALKGSNVRRVIYLSGLLPDDPNLSTHLRSRGEVEEILSLSDTPVTTLRAAQLIGSGSASFEMIRWLVDRLPVMVTPRWTSVRTQPIAITDALEYLTRVLECPESVGRSFDIGGPDILSYADLFRLYAEVASLRKRLLIPFPWMSLRFSARLVGLITPIPAALALPLIEGMRNEVVCHDDSIRQILPIELTPVKTAIERALGHVRDQSVKSSWLDAGLPFVPEWVQRGDAQYAESAIYRDGFLIRFAATDDEVWQPIVHIGGSRGWYSKNALWRLRGLMDRFMGGPGTQRGRRSEEDLYVGDGLDFWRVLAIEPQKRLLLLTEMRMPGEGLLDLRINPRGIIQGGRGPETELLICLYFRPSGVPGRLYWYAVSPFHALVFKAMLRSIAQR
ncbi:SDR family oxidoreductase, partial [Desulfovibrio sp. OttesenSCG-928-M14]|nr:SDR family oxidoreductase [Desulfovibrio sp. OttesenSCG-928-M14]